MICSALDAGMTCLNSVKGCNTIDNYINPKLESLKQFEDLCIQSGFMTQDKNTPEPTTPAALPKTTMKTTPKVMTRKTTPKPKGNKNSIEKLSMTNSYVLRDFTFIIKLKNWCVNVTCLIYFGCGNNYFFNLHLYFSVPLP